MARVKLGAALGTDSPLKVTKDRPTGPAPIPLEQLQPNPENPRPDTLEVDEMAADLAENGQLQNLNIMSRVAFLAAKPHLAERLTGARYVVINGHRRLAGATQAGLLALRAEVHDEWDRPQIDRAMVRENVHRLDLSPLLLGRQLLTMLADYNDSHRQLAAALNKTQGWVSQRIGLTTLHHDLQEALEDGRVLFRTARECTRLHPDLQPLLASGELPEHIAREWLLTERIKADEQLTRWQAGPPFYGTLPAPATPEPVDNSAPPPPAAPPPDPARQNSSKSVGDAASAAGTEGAPRQAPREDEYGVFTDADHGAASRSDRPAFSDSEDQAPPWDARPGEDEYPVFTPDPPPTSATARPVTINLPDRSMAALAQSLRECLSDDELRELLDKLAHAGSGRVAD